MSADDTRSARTDREVAGFRDGARGVPPFAAALRRQRGRLLVVGVLAVYFLVLALIGGQPAWDRLGVNDANDLPFIDLRSVTTAWECDREGVEVLPVIPCDPQDRPANYPALWVWPSFLGLGESASVPLGIAIGLIFLTSFLVLIGRPSFREASLYALAAISPTVMLAVERGNVDILLFAMVVAALIVFRRGVVGRVAGWALLFFAATLKLFPALAWGVLLRQPRRTALISGAVMVGLFAAYVAATYDTIRLIPEVLGEAPPYQYGADVGIDSLQTSVEGDPALGWLADAGDWLTAAALTAAACTIAALAWQRRSFGEAVAVRGDNGLDLRLDAFVAGAGVYVISFVIWHSGDYRMVFLLLTLPQLAAWTRTARSPVPAPRLTVAALLGAFWFTRPLTLDTGFWNPVLDPITLDDLGFSVDEIFNWLLFVTLGVGLVLATVLPMLASRERTGGR